MQPRFIDVPTDLKVDFVTNNPKCKGGNDGTIYPTISGGTAPYTVIWKDSLNVVIPHGPLNEVTALIAGEYTMTVTDSNGASLTLGVSLSEPLFPLAFGYTLVQPSIDNPQGVLSVFSAGGNGGYSYGVIPVGGDADWARLTVKFTDVGQSSRTFLVPQGVRFSTASELGTISGTELIFTLNLHFYDVSAATTTARVAELLNVSPATGYSSPYTIYSTTPATQPVWIEQVSSDTFILHLHLPSFTSLGYLICKDYEIFSVTEGTGNIWYQSQVTNGQILEQPKEFCLSTQKTYNLSTGNYIAWVRDARGCETIPVPITINSQPTNLNITLSTTNPLCNQGTDGAITINATGGQAPYTYSINGGFSYYTTNSFTGLGAGTYTIRVKDISGAYRQTSTTLTQPDQITITGTLSHFGQTVTTIPVLCPQMNDKTGSIGVVASGGTAPYTYTLVFPTNLQGYGYGYGYGGSDVNLPSPVGAWGGLPAGDYTVIVEDVNGCTENFLVTVTSNPPILISYSIDVIERNILPANLYIRKRFALRGVSGGQAFISDPTNPASVISSNPYHIVIRNSSMSVIYDSNNPGASTTPPVIATPPYPVCVGNIAGAGTVFFQFPLTAYPNYNQVGSETLFVEVFDYFGCHIVETIVI